MELASGVFPGGRSPCIAICCVKPPAGLSDSNHCAMAAPSVEDGNVYKLIKIIPYGGVGHISNGCYLL